MFVTQIIIISVLFFAVSLTLNILLLVLMLKYTPKSFANFGIVMKFQVIGDIQTVVAAAAVMSRTIPIDHSYVYIAHGPCTLISSTACFFSYGMMALGTSMNLYTVLASFIVRLLIVQNRHPSDRFIFVLLTLLTVPVPAAILVLFLCSRSDDAVIHSILQKKLPEYETRNATIFGIEDFRIATMSTTLLLMVVLTIPLYVIILLLRSKILKYMHETANFISKKTRNMHSQFVKMLTLQCAIPPVVFAVTVVPCELEYFNIRHPIMEAMINVLACLATLLSPIIVLSHVAPYRRAFMMRIEGRKQFNARSESALFVDETRHL